MAPGRKGKASQRPGLQKKEDRGIKRKREQDNIAELQTKVDNLVSTHLLLRHVLPSL